MNVHAQILREKYFFTAFLFIISGFCVWPFFPRPRYVVHDNVCISKHMSLGQNVKYKQDYYKRRLCQLYANV